MFMVSFRGEHGNKTKDSCNIASSSHPCVMQPLHPIDTLSRLCVSGIKERHATFTSSSGSSSSTKNVVVVEVLFT